MNNGHTRESKHRIAVLEDEDVETFVAFCEYAYTGDYSVPPLDALEEDHCPPVESATSVGNPWGGIFRSNSVSSAIPPPERMETVAQKRVKTQPELELVPGVEEPEVATTEDQEKIGHEHEKLENADPPQDAAPDAAGAVEEQLTADPMDAPNAEYFPWSPSTKKTAKKKKVTKAKQTKKTEVMADDPSSHLTPPSTPPLNRKVDDDNEIPPNNTDKHTIDAANDVETARPESKHGHTSSDPPAKHWEEPAPIFPGVNESHEQPWPEERHENESGEEKRPEPIIDMSFAKQQESTPRKPGLSLWDEFADLEYADEPSTCNSPPPDHSLTILPYLTFHAKVYVFATRYLIPALAQLCLRKLHWDLLHLSLLEPEDLTQEPQNLGSLAARKAQMVLDLLHYSYTKTARLEPISPTSATQLRENELRRLVVHYAACTVKDWACHVSSESSEAVTPFVRPVDAKQTEHAPRSLRALLDMTPELASDLVYRMM